MTSLVGAAISSGFALRILQVGIEPVTRPDKFTGTEGKALQAQIDALNVRVARLEAK